MYIVHTCSSDTDACTCLLVTSQVLQFITSAKVAWEDRSCGEQATDGLLWTYPVCWVFVLKFIRNFELQMTLDSQL